MSNRNGSRVALRGALFAFVSLLAACSKDKREGAGAAVSSAAPVVSSPAPAASPQVVAPAATIDVATARAVEKSCTSICERSSTLKCAHAGDCIKSCVGMAIGTPCSAEFSALYTCLLREPMDHWECSEDGTAAIREGYCEKEQERTVTCMEAKAQP